jgi:excisionase family DNA binding protein
MTTTTRKADLLTVREVATALGLTVRAVQYRIERGSLRAERYGVQFLVPRSELERVKPVTKVAP